MKMYVLFLFALLGLASCETAKNSVAADQVPVAVREAFTRNFPAVKAKWEVEDDGTYEAAFKRDGTEMTASISAAGELLETEAELDEKDLPAAVRNALNARFTGYEIEESERITYPDGTTAYEVAVEGDDDRELELLFAADGTLREQSEASDED